MAISAPLEPVGLPLPLCFLASHVVIPGMLPVFLVHGGIKLEVVPTKWLRPTVPIEAIRRTITFTLQKTTWIFLHRCSLIIFVLLLAYKLGQFFLFRVVSFMEKKWCRAAMWTDKSWREEKVLFSFISIGCWMISPYFRVFWRMSDEDATFLLQGSFGNTFWNIRRIFILVWLALIDDIKEHKQGGFI